MFTATKLQTATYLLGVCLFSISFLVFLNSSISFVVTDLIKLPTGEGDAVGTLGFADELLALVACPTWGMLSDRIGVRYVCTMGYLIIALALALFVQARNVYPELLLGRLLFSLGGSAVTTMVTAVLPAITASKSSLNIASEFSDQSSGITTPTPPQLDESQRSYGHAPRPSNASELTITPVLYRSRIPDSEVIEKKPERGSTSHLAGIVGMLTGSGAVVALLGFLPLPAWFEKFGQSPSQSIKLSYYIVALLSLTVSIVCFIGLRNLPDDRYTDWRSMFKPPRVHTSDELQPTATTPASPFTSLFPKSYLSQFNASFLLGFKQPGIGLAYLGGFVARASTVGISLFIPLYVNQHYRHSGLCDESGPGNQNQIFETDLGDIKKSCPKAYIVASILTGVAQLIALCFAPVFGYFSAKSKRHNIPLLAAALAGVIGYIFLTLLPTPQINGPGGSYVIFVAMALVGISQIGSIVCSLAGLSVHVLGHDHYQDTASYHSDSNGRLTSPASQTTAADDLGTRSGVSDERSSLLPKPTSPSTSTNNLVHLKGSVAGMYSLYGGAGILLLTKVGGLLSDKVSPKSPFYILAGFNGLLLIAGIVISTLQRWTYGKSV
ncbi:hypothetical protein AJ78_04323 [Emergomyces pasteurianus Ep9510]|uniref:Major facilitator superfamily (MFS) profile domain-containing protein n=1 Tax=Emergomyces pasteurianus Ep9510 TaxID=1447872 RepID=A0A1J9QGX3_9EURO|nr:hypothetical protein AJ78_04323 [Emergomyces pasteurianus Ep9510]